MTSRVELKFMLSTDEYLALRRQLNLIMESDKNVTHNLGYNLSSLYYDDMYDSATYEKADGVEFHRKFRIRYYDNGNINLEFKVKNQNITTKEVVVIDNELDDALTKRNYESLKKKIHDDLIARIFIQMKTNNLKPRLYVDYFREAYTFNNNDVRITFDKDIITYNWYNSNIKYKVLEPKQVIMEVKYTKTLPDFIRHVVFAKKYQVIPYSKYLMSWLKLNNLGV